MTQPADPLALAAGAAAASAIAAAVVLAATPPLARWLEARGSCVRDVFKKGRVMVPRPGGISIAAALLAAEGALYAAVPSPAVAAIAATTAGAFAAGLVDDWKRMGGWFKPATLAASSAPLLLLGAYDPDLTFPLFGDVHIPLLYLAVPPIVIAITGNTMNSIDVMNGVLSGFTAISGLALVAALLVLGNYTVAAAALPLAAASIAYWKFHRYPCRIFPGDSGALAMGAMFGAIAVAGGVEVIAAVALLPAVANSFLFLASTRKVMEYRHVKARDVRILEDMRMEATAFREAPVTLVRLILGRDRMGEREVCSAVLKLAAASAALAVATAAMTLLAGSHTWARWW